MEKRRTSINPDQYIHDLQCAVDWRKRKAAAEALAKFNDDKSFNILLITLSEDTEPDVRISVAQALARRKDPRAVMPLIARFKDENKKVKERAVQMLLQFGPQTVSPLIGSLADPDSRVRLAATRTLGLIKLENVAFGDADGGKTIAAGIEGLLPVLSDEDSHVRKAAFMSLGKLGGTLYKQIECDPSNPHFAITRMALDNLIGALSDKDSKVIAWAAEALGLFGAVEGIAPLREVLQGRDELAVKAAADALKRITPEKKAADTIIPGQAGPAPPVRHTPMGRMWGDQTVERRWTYQDRGSSGYPVTDSSRGGTINGFSYNRDFQPSFRKERGPPKMARPPVQPRAMPPASSPADHTAEKEPPAGTGTGSTGGSAAEPRYTNITFVHDDDKESQLDEKEPLMINTPYLLKVAVLTTPPSRDGPPVAIRDPQQDHQVTIHVAAEGEDFTITEPVQTFILPPSGNTKVPATFHIQAKRETPDPDSRSTIELSLYFNYFLIARIIVEAEVVGKTKKNPVSRFGLAPPIKIFHQPLVREIPDPGSVLPRKMNIRIRKEVSGYSLKFLYPEKDVGFTASLQLNEAELEDRIMRVRKLWYRIAMSKTFLSQLNGDDIEFTENVRDLAREGCRLWNMLFKRENESAIFKVGQFLKSNPLPEDSIIQVFFPDKGSTDFIFPWALLYDRDLPKDRNELPDPDGFWGIRYVIEQRMYNTPAGDKPVSTESKKPRLGFMLCDQFTNTQEQINLFKGLAAISSGRFEVSDPITYAKECYELLERPDSGCDILYFYVHGYTRQRLARHNLEPENKIFLEIYDTFDADLKKKFRRLYEGIKNNQYTLDDSWMELTDGIVYLEKLYSRVGNENDWTATPIVFLNMCESAQVTPALSDGFIRFFLDRGASCVIGTECPMTIEFAHPFAKEFFNGLLKGDCVGKAALKASRFFIRNNKNPLGLAYTIYGSVTPRFKPPPIQRPAVTALTGQPSGNG